MSRQSEFEGELLRVVRADGRYHLNAYLFMYQALDYTQETLQRGGHVSGRELLEGIRRLAQKEFGLMARTVFKSWGITKTEDFGEMVFSLVESGLLRKTEKDSREDFKEIYDFEQAFDESFGSVDSESAG